MKDAVTIVVVHVSRQQSQPLLHVGQDLRLEAGADPRRLRALFFRSVAARTMKAEQMSDVFVLVLTVICLEGDLFLLDLFSNRENLNTG